MKIRNLILPAILILFGITNLAAGKCNLGIRHGLNYSRFLNSFSMEMRSDLTAGIFYEEDYDNGVTFHLELTYSEKGGITKEIINDNFWYHYMIINETKVKYIEIPLLIKFYPRKMKIARPYLIWGPHVAYMTEKQNLYKSGYNPDPNSSVDRIDKFDTGFIVGFGLSLTRTFFSHLWSFATGRDYSNCTMDREIVTTKIPCYLYHWPTVSPKFNRYIIVRGKPPNLFGLSHGTSPIG